MKTKGRSSEKGFGMNHTSFANMPQEVVMREYPKVDFALNQSIDDTITGIDDTTRQVAGQMRRHKPKARY